MTRLDQSSLQNNRIKTLFCKRVSDFYRKSEKDDSYSKLEQAMDRAAFSTLEKSTRPQPGWFVSNQNRLNRLIDERNIAVSLNIRKPTRYSATRVKKARKNLKSEITRTKNKWILNVCREINSSENEAKLCWDKVKLLRKGLDKPKAT